MSAHKSPPPPPHTRKNDGLKQNHIEKHQEDLCGPGTGKKTLSVGSGLAASSPQVAASGGSQPFHVLVGWVCRACGEKGAGL